MPARTPNEWLFEDWQLIARALNVATHGNCRCYECDTIDALLGDIAHYWDLNDHELAETMCWRRPIGEDVVDILLFWSLSSDRLILLIKSPYISGRHSPTSTGVPPGDQVRIHLDPADPDAHTPDTVCEILDVLTDDLNTETGRPTDTDSYRLRDPETDEKLPLTVRHQDLVPAEHTQ